MAAIETLFRTLSGVSAEIVARYGKIAFREAALFTHRGLSGPAILQISSYWRHGEPIETKRRVGCAPPSARRRAPLCASNCGEALPDRLAETLADRIVLSGEIATMDRSKPRRRRTPGWPAGPSRPTAPEGFAKAEVTIGGISTAELSSQTMESRRVPGFYAIGEAVDVTGWLGGYNFQWAIGLVGGPPHKRSEISPCRSRSAPHVGLLMPFSNLPPLLSEALAARGYAAPTPVQAAVLEAGGGRPRPPRLRSDRIGQDRAFGLAMAAQLLEDDRLPIPGKPLALIIAPTRELALQVSRELIWLFGKAHARVATCVGGMDASKERRSLSHGAHLVVGTPGRLRDHLERGALDLSALRVAVLDEADEMLDMGFREDLEEILDATPLRTPDFDVLGHYPQSRSSRWPSASRRTRCASPRSGKTAATATSAIRR